MTSMVARVRQGNLEGNLARVEPAVQPAGAGRIGRGLRTSGITVVVGPLSGANTHSGSGSSSGVPVKCLTAMQPPWQRPYAPQVLHWPPTSQPLSWSSSGDSVQLAA